MIIAWFKSLFSPKPTPILSPAETKTMPSMKPSASDAYTLRRVSSNEEGTFGVLVAPDGKPLCLTLEDPWNNNEQNVSCIPAGEYRCVPHNGTKYKNVWLLENVPNRSAILIHQGNNRDHTQGCILVGRQFGIIDGKVSVLSSNQTLAQLRGILPKRFALKIDW